MGRYGLGESFNIAPVVRLNDYVVLDRQRSSRGMEDESGGFNPRTQTTEIFRRATLHPTLGTWDMAVTYTVNPVLGVPAPDGVLVPSFVKAPKELFLVSERVGVLKTQTLTCLEVGTLTIELFGKALAISQSVQTKMWVDGVLTRDEPSITGGHGWDTGTVTGECVATSLVLFDAETFEPTDDPFGPNGTHVRLQTVTGGLDRRTALPIIIAATDPHTSEVLQVVEISSVEDCLNATRCSIDFERISVPHGTWVRLVARDSLGNLLAWKDYQA